MSGHFEAKKHAYRQTQDGVVISFVMHPSDVDAAIATAPLGTRYMIGFAEILDDGTPKTELAQDRTVESSSGLDSTPTKSPRKWNDFSYAEQAGMRSNERSFWEFSHSDNAEEAAQFIRERCGVSSRAHIKPGTDAEKHWRRTEDVYQAWLNDRAYAEVRR